MRPISSILASLLAAGLTLQAADTRTYDVKVGEQTLSIPSPAGFDRMDGIDPQRDEMAAQFIAAGNRYVIMFGTPAAVAALRRGESADSPRNFNAQTSRKMEGRPVKPVEFETLRVESERDLDRLGRRLDAVLGKVGADASKSLSDKLQESVEVKIGDPVPLGIFERTRDSVGFSMMFKSQIIVAGKDAPALNVVAAMIVRVRDRVLYLYATSERKSEADEAWVKTEVLKWRDAIFAANGQTDSAPSSTASRILQQINFQRILLIGGVGAGIGILIALLARPRRPKHSRPPSP